MRMPVRPLFNPDFLYFVTTKAVHHAHLFRHDVMKRIIVDSLRHLRAAGRLKLFVFVVMPNHIHFIGKFSPEKPMSSVMRDFKKHTARLIYLQTQVEEDEDTLRLVQREGSTVHQEYKVWERGYDAREIFTSPFREQKMNYIHQNPCQERWKLVHSPEQYLWSTARYYLAGKPAIIPIDDLRDFLQAPSG